MSIQAHLILVLILLNLILIAFHEHRIDHIESKLKDEYNDFK